MNSSSRCEQIKISSRLAENTDGNIATSAAQTSRNQQGSHPYSSFQNNQLQTNIYSNTTPTIGYTRCNSAQAPCYSTSSVSYSNPHLQSAVNANQHHQYLHQHSNVQSIGYNNQLPSLPSTPNNSFAGPSVSTPSAHNFSNNYATPQPYSAPIVRYKNQEHASVAVHPVQSTQLTGQMVSAQLQAIHYHQQLQQNPTLLEQLQVEALQQQTSTLQHQQLQTPIPQRQPPPYYQQQSQPASASNQLLHTPTMLSHSPPFHLQQQPTPEIPSIQPQHILLQQRDKSPPTLPQNRQPYPPSCLTSSTTILPSLPLPVMRKMYQNNKKTGNSNNNSVITPTVTQYSNPGQSNDSSSNNLLIQQSQHLQQSPRPQQFPPPVHMPTPQAQKNTPQAQRNATRAQKKSPLPQKKTPKAQKKVLQVQKKAQVESQTPQAQTQPSQIKQPPPQILQQLPKIQQLPQIRQQLPQIQNQLPQVQQQLPQVQQQLPQVQQQLPQIQQQVPHIQQQVPHIQQQLPQILLEQTLWHRQPQHQHITMPLNPVHPQPPGSQSAFPPNTRVTNRHQHGDLASTPQSSTFQNQYLSASVSRG